MQTVASFSAEGPTMDGRIKPDIIVPGELISSAKGYRHSSSETCDLVSKQGTSMATPVAAAGGALIRQYFEVSEDISLPHSHHMCVLSLSMYLY